ncbi:hypothetical protein HF521_010353 [Silurus meridionalis]|uniref:Uncharacterized protein n=1 Tax=Silurus meridionalis TaxID=175797 RepID=A0A8T0ALT1_SILME|nr:hypothetical protein HF521_010353 [Silurus meridionalis]
MPTGLTQLQVGLERFQRIVKAQASLQQQLLERLQPQKEKPQYRKEAEPKRRQGAGPQITPFSLPDSQEVSFPSPQIRSRSSGRSSRRRSRSRERDRCQRKTRDKDRDREKDRGGDRGRDRDKKDTKAKEKKKLGDAVNIKAGLEHLTAAEQAKARLQLVLQAAARTDEALKAKEKKDEEERKIKAEEEVSLAEQVRRIKEIEAIESDSFVPQAFKSSRDAAKVIESAEIQEAESGDISTVREDVISLPTAIKYSNSDTLAHPSVSV